METTYLANGCFWCTEAVFQRLRGVNSVLPGYSGGTIENPTYEQVSTGNTGHAESIEIKFDPKQISYQDLLYVFFKTHDPTTLNRQGGDEGPQYRSAIFYTNEKQKEVALKAKDEAQKDYEDSIVTEVVKFEKFYPAEDYHKDFYNNNREYGYCKLVIDPKIKKLQEIIATKPSLGI